MSVSCVCLPVCMSVRPHISGTTRPNFIKFSMHVACDHISVLSGGVVIRYVLPVLWMTSCFPKILHVGVTLP